MGREREREGRKRKEKGRGRKERERKECAYQGLKRSFFQLGPILSSMPTSSDSPSDWGASL